MIKNNPPDMARRRFVMGLTWLLPGVVGLNPKTAKADLTQFLGHIEIDTLMASKPRKHPACFARQDRRAAWLFRKNARAPFLKINETAATIWSACDGRKTASDISDIIAWTYRVDPHQAYVDCLLCIALLNARGALVL